MTESDPESDRFLITMILIIIPKVPFSERIPLCLLIMIMMTLFAIIPIIIIIQHINARLAIIKRSNKSKYDNDFAWEEAR